MSKDSLRSLSIGLKEMGGSVLFIGGSVFCTLCLLVTGIVIFMPDEGGKTEAIILMLVLDCLFAGAVFLGKRIKDRIRRYQKYIVLLSRERLSKLSDIAAATGKPVAFVKADISIMIRKKYFRNVCIDESKNTVIVSGNLDGIDSSGLNIESVICANCSAVVVKRANDVGVCDYCGTKVI